MSRKPDAPTNRCPMKPWKDVDLERERRSFVDARKHMSLFGEYSRFADLACHGLWEPYSGGLMYPAREYGDTCRQI